MADIEFNKDYLYPTIDLGVHDYRITDEDIQKLVGLPITYKGKTIGKVLEAKGKQLHWNDSITLMGVVYDKHFFRNVVQPDCSNCCMVYEAKDTGEPVVHSGNYIYEITNPVEIRFMDGTGGMNMEKHVDNGFPWGVSNKKAVQHGNDET